MISKEQAMAEAEEVLAVERRRLGERHNARAPLVPGMRLSPEWSVLQPRHEATLMREARRSVHSNGWFVALGAAWIAGVGVAWYFTRAGQSAFGLLWAIAPALGVTSLRHWFIRRELNRLIASSTSDERGEPP